MKKKYLRSLSVPGVTDTIAITWAQEGKLCLGRMDVGRVLNKQVAVSHRIELGFQDLMERTVHKQPSTFHRRMRRLQRAKTREKLVWTNSPRTRDHCVARKGLRENYENLNGQGATQRPHKEYAWQQP